MRSITKAFKAESYTPFFIRPFCFKSRKVYFYAHFKKLAMLHCQIPIAFVLIQNKNQNGGIKNE